MSLGRKIVALFMVLGFSVSFGSFVVLKLTVFQAFQEFENKSDVSGFGDKALHDMHGNTVASLDVLTPRRIIQIGADLTKTVTLLLVASSAIFLLAALLFIRRLIVVPLTRLTQQISGIRKTGNLYFEAGSNRSDEVGVLAGEFEAMTRQLSAAQEKLKQARDEALATSRAKTEFLARPSHEGRTPMNGVSGVTELLRKTQLEFKQRRVADSIYESAETLRKIINDILDLSKKEAGMLSMDDIDVHLRSRAPIIAATACVQNSDMEQAGEAEDLASADAGAGSEAVRPDSVIDSATLRRLAKLQQPGAPNILRKLLNLYLESSRVTKERLRNAIECSNASVVRECAYALKSSSLNVGAKDLAELCKKLEIMGRESEIFNAQTFKELLETEYARVVCALRAELRKMSA